MGHEKDMRRMERFDRFDVDLCPHDGHECQGLRPKQCRKLGSVVYCAREQREIDDQGMPLEGKAINAMFQVNDGHPTCANCGHIVPAGSPKCLNCGEICGRKFDDDKLRWDLLPTEPVREIVRVLTLGAKKYAPDNWKHVDEWRRRYYAASMRHLTAWWEGERDDPETGIHHLAHVGCCILFLLWLDGLPTLSGKTEPDRQD